MTTKQIAEATGKGERTVRRWVEKVSAGEDVMAVYMAAKLAASTSSHPADYNLEETLAIITFGMGQKAAEIYRINAEQTPAKSSNLDEQFKAAIVGISALVQGLNARVEKVEYQQHQRAALLPAPQKNARAELTQLVNKYAHHHKAGDFSAAWRELYREIYYRLHINVRVRAKNEGVSCVDIIDRDGLLESACAIVGELLGGDV